MAERTLRILALASSLVCLPLVVIGGAVSSRLGSWYRSHTSPVLFGFIPFALTLCTTLFYLILAHRARKQKIPQTEQKSRPLLWAVADFFIWGAYIGVLLPFWLNEPNWLGEFPQQTRIMLLEGYGSVGLIMNMCIHAYLCLANFKGVFTYLIQLLKDKSEGEGHQCPHCHHRIRKGKMPMADKRTGEGYSLLRGEEDLDTSLYDDDAGVRGSSDVRRAVGEQEQGVVPNLADV